MFISENTSRIFVIISSILFIIWYSYLDLGFFDIGLYYEELGTLQTVFTILFLFCYYFMSFVFYVDNEGKNVNVFINETGEKVTFKLNVFEAMIFKVIFLPLFLATSYRVLLIVSLFYGVIFSFVFYIKGRLSNSTSKVNKPTYNIIKDFYDGIELIPRISTVENVDLKLFVVGHIGMCLWFLLNLRNAVVGLYNGTSIPFTIAFLQAFYILFWAANEEWYLHTIDMNYDKLGYYLCFGGFCWIPAVYCNYTYYTSIVIVEHDTLTLLLYCVIYFIGFYIFYKSNIQRYMFRKGLCPQLSYIEAKYICNDEICSNKLLIDGWWKSCRHINYLGDIIMVLSLSLIVGFNHIISHLYTVMLIFLLLHRIQRDELKCLKKYGDDWLRYKSIVPYALIPGIY